MIAAESSPGIHGGISPAFVIRTIPAACALASAAVVSENGAIPPSRWHDAHFASRIGATSRLYVGPEAAEPRTASASAPKAVRINADFIVPHCTSNLSRRVQIVPADDAEAGSQVYLGGDGFTPATGRPD